MYDLIIIGAGPAGLAAAVYAARQKIKFAVIAKKIGGQTAMSSDVENYLGFHLVSGAELISKFQEHLKDYDIELKTSEVTSLEKNGDNFIVRTQEESFETKSVLVTSGKEPRKLSVPGEKEFTSKGVTYCATCDAPLFGGKDVAVIGGGNAGFETAAQ
ncbi:MAG: NAD(P)/FAD-dependent oxidoreductase, partial [Candidatus Micrarchaeia archaeon]